MADRAPVTVVETPEFLAATRKLMGEEERGLLSLEPEERDAFRLLAKGIADSHAKRRRRLQ